MNYLNLNRRFVERESYRPEELVAYEIAGKPITWSKLQESRFTVIVAPANFGKTTEMQHRANEMRARSEMAVFVALRRLADRGSLEKALDEAERAAYQKWRATPESTLTLFIDSLDEAAAGKKESIEYLLSDIATEISWPSKSVNWVISTRPAVLTTQLFDWIASLLARPALTLRESGSPSTKVLPNATPTTTSESTEVIPEKLRVFSMMPLDGDQAQTYLNGRYPNLASDEILRLARQLGLSGFARSPGGIEILARIDLLSSPPPSLTDVFDRVAGTIRALRGADIRLTEAGSPRPESLGEAAQKLASAAQLCQLLNIEMPEETLAIPEKALSARLIASSVLTERAINQLLGSQLFIDAGFHQVKVYPDELQPFLAAQRLAQLAQSPDQAQRLMQNFTWSAPSGECGIRRDLLPTMGWLATMNPHCRSVILQYEPQALAFFGDLRNNLVPLSDATEALSESIRRLVENGDHPGRGMFTLTSENFWQAGPKRLAPVIMRLLDKYGDHHCARDVLMDIATACKLDGVRTKVLRRHQQNYERLLGDSTDVHYLLELGEEADYVGLAAAIKLSETARASLVALLIGKLGWKYFTPTDVARLIDQQYLRGQDGYHIGYVLESANLLKTATEQQLYQLARSMVIRVARLCDRDTHEGRASRLVDDRYAEMAAEAVAALVNRASPPNSGRVARVCFILRRVLSEGRFGGADTSSVRRALEANTPIRRDLLKMISQQSGLSDQQFLMLVIGYYSACRYTAEDIQQINSPRLSNVYDEFFTREAVAPEPPPPKHAKSASADRLKVTPSAKKALLGMVAALRDGTGKSGLEWVAQWLLQTSTHSRYSEVDFKIFERTAGATITDAVRQGFSNVWRKEPPRFDEAQPQSTYHITAAGLQGLYADLGTGAALPSLSESEVRRALRYGAFEINGYPKWYWPLVSAYPDIAKSELSKMARESGNGAVSKEHAEHLFMSLADAPADISVALAPLAWAYLTKGEPTQEFVAEQILHSIMTSPTKIRQSDFERTASGIVKRAFKSPLPEEPDNARSAALRQAAVWGGHWLMSYPVNFQRAVRQWGPKDPLAVRAFIARMASYFGRDRTGAMAQLARASDDGVMVLEDIYHWTKWAVPPADDIPHSDGVVYTPTTRDDAQRFRDGLLGAIASANSQFAYEVLARIFTSASGLEKMYVRSLQFEMRERQFAKAPLSQISYDQFENDFKADVTDTLSLAMAVHSDLLAVKYDIERGEHSLRNFFSALDFTRVNKKGVLGEQAGLALEVEFQRLLASELNHHALGRYSVTVESNTAESKRRDVLCSRNDWRASIELKMSERWTLDDYVIALERQLLGQYMRHNKATIGFLVLVLQTKDRRWKNLETGKTVGFDELLSLLGKKAQALESKNRSLYLRVIGIDATAPDDFRKKH
ncbi:hypothetical protein OKW40_000762 [Paraburkholderia sp. RAU6.4a]|uniref:hypothetical protein n=1 Tax=Paraburkholderia sp. RAU6.4a TaxID=2991067 RepID=UPI003D1E85F5